MNIKIRDIVVVKNRFFKFPALVVKVPYSFIPCFGPLHCCFYRYIEKNPVRAGMVPSPANYRWSSHHCNAAGTPDKLVSPHDGYRALGASDAARQRAYVGMFDAALPEETVCRIRDATNKAWVLGDDSFRARVEALVKRQTSPCVRGGDRKSDGFRDRRKINRV